MYLLCCSDTLKHELIKKFGKDKFYNKNIQYLETQILPNYNQIELLKSKINDFDYVILISPTCINLVQDAITIANNPVFLVMGETSYLKLSEFTNNKILYPKKCSGVSGLLEEVLNNFDLKTKKILLVKGFGGDFKLENSLKNSVFLFKIIEVYTRVGQLLLENDFKKILDTNEYQGIIITSSTQVDWLFNSAKLYNCFNEFKSLDFLTWHKNIEYKLKSYGVKDNKIKYITNPLYQK